jgi:capsular exopolysaccharide synthesis family protein
LLFSLGSHPGATFRQEVVTMHENHEASGGLHSQDSQDSVVLMNKSRQLSVTNTSELMGVVHGYGPYNEMRLGDLWDILARRRTVVFATLLTCVLAGALTCAFWTRRYMATAELQVGRETENNLGLQTDGSQEPPLDSLSESITIQTQAGILQSDTLALRVINALSLESTQDFRPKFNPIGYVMGVFALDGPPDPSHATIEESPRRRARALEVFHSNLGVKPIAGTRLIEISYSNPDPKLAALVVNHLANSLVDYNFQIRHEATSHTTEWLAGQMSDLRQQSEDLQSKVAELQRESGVFSLGETDAQGREQVYSSVLDKLQQATTALSQAQANRIGKAAIYQVAQTGDPEAISQLSGSSIFASSSGLDSSLSLIQSMRMQEATLRGQLGEMAAKFGPAYPKLSEMRGSLDALADSIHAEVNRTAKRALNDYEVAQQVENNARSIYLEQKHQADLVNDKTIEYVIARKEAEESRNLYESLFRQLKQSGVLAGFRANNISLVDPARVPAKPAQPKVLLYMAAALVGGLFLGACGALLKDGTDTRIHNPMVLESDLGQIPLGVLPYHKSSTNSLRHLESKALPQPEDSTEPPKYRRLSTQRAKLPAIDEPHSGFVEALRALRTTLFLSKARTPPRVILVTSSVPGEGKTMLSANFAALLAGQDKKVLLVDADLRHPNLHHALNLTSEEGLSWLLTTWENFDIDGPLFEKLVRSVISPIPDISHLYFVASGPTPEQPAELLSSDRMCQAIKLWRSWFDYVVIDGPPVLSVTDSVILSGLVDLTLLTARYQVIEQQALRRAYSVLRSQADHNNVGIVLNGVRKAAGTYYPAYGFESSRHDSNRGGLKRETA